MPSLLAGGPGGPACGVSLGQARRLSLSVAARTPEVHESADSERERRGRAISAAGQAALRLFDFGLSTATRNWLREAGGLFYAFHFYTLPRRAEDAVRNAVEIGALWGMPVVLTEFMACDAYRHAEAANVSWTYWHYSQYCNTAPSPQCDAARAAGRPCNFVACICGWGMGRSNWSCDASGGPGAARLIGDVRPRAAVSTSSSMLHL